MVGQGQPGWQRDVVDAHAAILPLLPRVLWVIPGRQLDVHLVAARHERLGQRQGTHRHGAFGLQGEWSNKGDSHRPIIAGPPGNGKAQGSMQSSALPSLGPRRRGDFPPL